MMKKSALISLQSYGTDESSSSDNEFILERNKNIKVLDGLRIKANENASNRSQCLRDDILKLPLKMDSSAIYFTDKENNNSQSFETQDQKPEENSDMTSSSDNKLSITSYVDKNFTAHDFPLSSIPLPPTEENPLEESCVTPTRKRTHSMTENDFLDNRSEIRKSLDNRDINFASSKPPIIKARRSLPTNSYSSNFQSSSETPKRNSFAVEHLRRKSYSSTYRSCATDQTPYSPARTYQKYKKFKTSLPYYNPSDLITFKSDHGFIDSHCHLDFLLHRQHFNGSYKDYQKKHQDTFPECYKGCLAVFCNPHTFQKKHIWKDFIEEDNVWASFGCHPHNAKDYNDEIEESLRIALEHPKVRALGEIGLDYSNRNDCLHESQHEVFRRQLRIALEKKLPLVIHCREAHYDGLKIMKEMVPKDYFIHLHCFTDTWELASQWLQEFPNLFIGITNVVTFPSAGNVHEVTERLPLSRLLLETDAPYFVPKPLLKEHPNTRTSHPGMAIHVAAQIAAIKGVPLELVLSNTRQNTKKMYKI